VALVGVLLYSWFRPLTPREVCERLDEAKSLKEAFRYMTLKLRPAFEAMEKDGGIDEGSPSEYTREGEAPAGLAGYLVGVRTHFYSPEEKRKVQIDGVFHLVDSDGWKVEDLYFCGLDHQSGTHVLSMARDYHLLLNPPQVEEGQNPLPEPSPAERLILSWHQAGKGQTAAPSGTLLRFLSTAAGRFLCGVLITFCLAAAWFDREKRRSNFSSTRHPVA
jgi:hypothetical protein